MIKANQKAERGMITESGLTGKLTGRFGAFVGAGHARDSESLVRNSGPNTGYPLSGDVQDVPVHSSKAQAMEDGRFCRRQRSPDGMPSCYPDSAEPLKGGIRRRGLRSGIRIAGMASSHKTTKFFCHIHLSLPAQDKGAKIRQKNGFG